MSYQRNEISRCIRENNIDKSRFFEASKQSYAQIIKNIENAFVDKSKSWDAGIHWANMGNYKRDIPLSIKTVENQAWVEKLRQIIPDEAVYVLFEDTKSYEPKYWLYEACVSELITVLSECVLWGDFYIVSKKYDWLISLNHHDILSFVGNRVCSDCL